MKLSIFDIETRISTVYEAKRLNDFLLKKIFAFEEDAEYYESYVNFFELIDTVFTYWPHRKTALNVTEYFKLLSLKHLPQEMNESDVLYFFQFIYSIIYWLYWQSIECSEYKNRFKELMMLNQENFSVITQNIKHVLEYSNYEVKENFDMKQILFIKKDSDLDSVIENITTNECRYALLEYNDFRIETDISAKKALLIKIAAYLEPQKKLLSEHNKTLTKDIYFILNSFEIRHNNENACNLSDYELLDWYNKLYKMILHLLRSQDIKKYQEELNHFKQVK